ncbi:hypothetical protein UYSO10_1217 [Kosakonia radicincitans]|nr:hypothetical protein UYSO10_1217 [Kosakonia radicincitans]
MAVGVTPISSAAALKLMWRATASKARMAESGGNRRVRIAEFNSS